MSQANVELVRRGLEHFTERQDALVYELSNGKIVRCDYYNSRRQALEAVGLA